MAMLVDVDGGCYLDPDAEVEHRGFLTVRRDQDGYHVVNQMPGALWDLEPISDELKAKLIPVATVTVLKI
jgi:hypothetical protein